MSLGHIGQGSFELGETGPTLPDIDLSQRVAISSIIKHISDVRNPSPALVTERDMGAMTPHLIASGLFVAEGKRDIDQERARNGVIFPAEQYKFIMISPLHVARSAANGVRAKRRHETDKAAVDHTAHRAAGHALSGMLERSDRLVSSLRKEEADLTTINRELRSARGTGYFAHYTAKDLRMMITGAETAIFGALDVAATTRGWDEQTYTRAKRTLDYQLYGRHDRRYGNWKDYAAMASRYARARRLVVQQSQRPVRTKLEKYQPYLDNA